MDCDNRALRQCQAACYSSEWAAQAAVERHGADAAKVHVLPFGANLDRRAAQEDLPALAAQRLKPPWRFLFVGVDWERKGATQAVEVVRQLNALGHPSELIVVGCHPPKYAAALPDYVRAEGFISQHDPAGRERLSELFASSLFYLMPSRAEAYGIVFCEANVQGVPCLSTRTGGIPTIVHQGCNGALFDLDAPAGEYVDFVLAHTSYERYLDLARGSLAAYQERLSWKVNIRKLQELLAAASGRASVAASAVPETASLST
jgi:glycosyltransferase involved in cell wall biosynthesis